MTSPSEELLMNKMSDISKRPAYAARTGLSSHARACIQVCARLSSAATSNDMKARRA
jgi:hypothetical protein